MAEIEKRIEKVDQGGAMINSGNSKFFENTIENPLGYDTSKMLNSLKKNNKVHLDNVLNYELKNAFKLQGDFTPAHRVTTSDVTRGKNLI